MTLCIGQLNPITVYRADFWVCAVLFWCWVSLCFLFTNSFIECYFIVMVATTIGLFMFILFILNYTFRFSESRQFWFCNYALLHSWIYLLLDILFILNYTFRFSEPRQFWFCNYALLHSWIFLLLDILFEYWIEHVTFGLLYVMFRFRTRISYRGVRGFVMFGAVD